MSSKSFGWGAYGHEQINSEAIDLIKQTAFGACAVKNRDMLVRLAVTPDLDWKMSSQDFFALSVYNLAEQLPKYPQSTKMLSKVKKILDQEARRKKKYLSDDLVSGLGEHPTDATLLAQLRDQEQAAGQLGTLTYEDLKKKVSIDDGEHSLHFWEADAYVNQGEAKVPQIFKLPSSADFDGSDLSDYEKKVKANEKAITQIDPCKTPSGSDSRDVVQHGTAPWRAYSLMKSAAYVLSTAVKNHDADKFNQALLLLGTMGHYVGDMGQPFHATLDYDGQTDAATFGVHSSYEEKILERYGKQNAHARQDKATKLWGPFDATSATVDRYAQNYLNHKAASDVAEDKVIPAVFGLVANGYNLIDPLLAAFKSARLADDKFSQLELPITDCNHHSKRTAIHAVTLEQFMNAPIQVAGIDHKISVVESAEKRMGEASAVLAQLWLTALKLSKVSDSEFKNFCPTTNFNADYAIKGFREFVINNYPPVNYHQPASDFSKRDQESEVSADGESEDGSSSGSDDQAQPQPRQPDSVKKKKK